jgi:hypothetical protein
MRATGRAGQYQPLRVPTSNLQHPAVAFCCRRGRVRVSSGRVVPMAGTAADDGGRDGSDGADGPGREW